MKNELKIVGKRSLTSNVIELELEGSMVQNMHKPGQFLHIKVPQNDLILRRPISIAQINRDLNRCTVVIRKQGPGTQAILETVIESYLDVLGPLGNGFPIDMIHQGQRALLIGGGIGVPPLLECVKQLHLNDVKCTIVLGFMHQEHIFYEAEFKQYGEVISVTDDGSNGRKGHVGSVLDTLDSNFDAIYACGPKGMNRMLNERFKAHPNAYVSLEERMGCGMGACAGCVVFTSDNQRNYRVCIDGPVFRCGEVQI